jgi:hypothetical protein
MAIFYTHAVFMSDFLPSSTENKPSNSHTDIKSNSKSPAITKGSSTPHSLKTSDDTKWRVGLHVMDPMLGAKFDGVKVYKAKEVLENAADGEFRLVFGVEEWGISLCSLKYLQF